MTHNNIKFWRLWVRWTIGMAFISSLTSIALVLILNGDLVAQVPAPAWGALGTLLGISSVGAGYIFKALSRNPSDLEGGDIED